MAQSKSIFVGFLLLAFLIGIGTFSISVLEDESIFEAFYFTVLTVTTVGATNIDQITFGSRVIVICIISLGMGTVLYLATNIASAMIEGNTRQIFSGLRGGLMRIKKEKNHIIVCGFGKLGTYVVETLKQHKKKYLIIEEDIDQAQTLLSKNLPILQGNALDPHVLEKANISKAKAIIGALKNDADNIYLIMTALELNPNILCAAKASDEKAVKRLHKVGAQVVVFPEVVGGRQLANAVIEIDKSENLSTISKKKKV